MAPSDFATADIHNVVEQLSLKEAISLIAGANIWDTSAIPRLGIPALKVNLIILRGFNTVDLYVQLQVSDGPNGVRGARFFMGTPAKCLPVSKSLAQWKEKKRRN